MGCGGFCMQPLLGITLALVLIVPSGALVDNAICHFRPTVGSTLASGSMVTFGTTANNLETASLTVCGLDNGVSVRMDMRQYGDLGSDDGSAAGPARASYHYDFTTSNDGSGCTTLSNIAPGDMNDFNNKRLDDFLGYALQLRYGAAGSTLAQCVVGHNDEEVNTVRSNTVTGVTSGICHLEPTDFGSAFVDGFIVFEEERANNQRTNVRAFARNAAGTIELRIRGNLGGSTALDTDGTFGPLSNAGGAGTFSTVDPGSSPKTIVLGGNNPTAGGYVGDTTMRFDATDSIIGRGVIVKTNTGTAVARCVIGRVNLPEVPVATPGTSTSLVPVVVSATTTMQPVLVNGAAPFPSPQENDHVGGVVDIYVDGSNVTVRYHLTGLPYSTMENRTNLYSLEFSALGNTCLDDASSRGAASTASLAGLGNFVISQPDTGFSQGVYVTDTTQVPFVGDNSIVGQTLSVRYTMVNDNTGSNQTALVGFGVVGIKTFTTAQQAAPANVFQAGCRLTATEQDPNNDVTGYISFSSNPAAGVGLEVQYHITGLTPGDHTWHVHDFGDLITSSNGLATGGHFVGVPAPSPARPTGDNEVGAIANGAPITANSDGVAIGSLTDAFIALGQSNYNILGHSMIIHAVGGGSARVAQCVIGRTVAAAAVGNARYPTPCESRLPENSFVPKIVDATCALGGTSGAPNPITGSISFSANDTGVVVTFDVCGLANDGSHPWHVHTLGDVFQGNGKSTGGHFRNCTAENITCRTGLNVLNEVGAIWDSTPLSANSSGCASGTFIDTVIALNGENSIVGRSIIIHGDTNGGTNGQRWGSCVIGRADDHATEQVAPLMPAAPYVARASCVATGGAGWSYVTITQNNAAMNDRAAGTTDFRVQVFGVDVGTPKSLRISQSGALGDTNVMECMDTALDCGGVRAQAGDMSSVVISTATGTVFQNDAVLQLNGKQSIIGRTLRLTGNEEQTCVVGIMDESTLADLPMQEGGVMPYVSQGSVILRTNTSAYAGYADIKFDSSMMDSTTTTFRVTLADSSLASGNNYRAVIFENGDLCDADGSFRGNMYTGPCTSCRDGSIQAVGYVADGLAWEKGTTGGIDSLRAQWTDSVITSYGSYHVIGRLFGILDNATDTLVASGVIGIAVEHNGYLVNGPPARASFMACELDAVDGQTTNGYFRFRYSSTDGLMYINGRVNSLPADPTDQGSGWHVHTYGDVSDERSALGTSGHFIGVPNPDRTLAPNNAALNEVGLLDNGRKLFRDANDNVLVDRIDTYVTNVGRNSILGRSLVIHDPSGPPRVSQCVLGYAEDQPATTPPPCSQLPDNPQKASAWLRPVIPSTGTNANTPQGKFDIVQVDPQNSPNAFQLSWWACGLTAGQQYVWQVHEFGNPWRDDGSGLGAVYTSAPAIPTSSALTGTCYEGSALFNNTFTLRGPESLVGRGLALYQGSVSPENMVAMSVIGRSEETTEDYVDSDPAVQPYVRRAICRFETTSLTQASAGGFMIFEDLDVTPTSYTENRNGTRPGDSTNGVALTFFAYGMEEGPHEFHVHVKGDISQQSGNAVGDHFIGSDCDNVCRPGSDEQEVGRIGSGGYALQAVNGVASGYYVDPVITLNGIRSIIGRSIIIHARGTQAAEKEVMCVIGIMDEGPPAAFTSVGGATTDTPFLYRATAMLEPSVPDRRIVGNIQLEFTPPTLAARYIISGLVPGETYDWGIHQTGDLCTTADVGTETTNFNLDNITADADGIASGYFETSGIDIDGASTIIGRAVVISQNGTSLSVGVFGRNGETSAANMIGTPGVTEATCRMEPTFVISNPLSATDADLDIKSYFTFSYSGTTMTISYSIQNIAEGAHKLQVHDFGNVMSLDTGFSTGDAFVLIGNVNVNSFGNAQGSFTSTAMSFGGATNVLGRSLVLRATTSSASPIIGTCVIGRAETTVNVPSSCSLLETIVNPSTSSDDDNTSTIVGISVGVVLGVLFCCGFMYWCTRPRPAAKGFAQPGAGGTYVAGYGPSSQADVELADAPAASGAARKGTAVDLPPNWEAHHDDEGNVYYYNTATQKSVWDVPTA